MHSYPHLFIITFESRYRRLNIISKGVLFSYILHIKIIAEMVLAIRGCGRQISLNIISIFFIWVYNSSIKFTIYSMYTLNKIYLIIKLQNLTYAEDTPRVEF